MTFALTILGPLLAAAAILVLRRGAGTLALAGAGAGLLGALVSLALVAGGERLSTTLPGLPGLPLRLVAEPTTASLAVIVAVAGALILVYAVGYMKGERGQARFFAGMSFFVAAMQALVFAGDWVLLLAAWELIGLGSYLLISFHFEREGIGGAASRAFLYTRTADLGLYAGIFVLVTQAGTTGIPATLDVGGPAAVAAGLLLLVAAAGKSAQVPLYGWLQDAMVGPTPVSALLHSATLVAAGVILLIRAFPLLPPGVLLVVGALGGVTAVVAGLVAVAQRNLKRLLAASTSSQYGLMFLALGAGSPVAALAHLAAHAAIKSSLFLGAGVFQHARGSTDFADLAGVGRARGLTFLGFAVAGLSLAGVPPLAGFFSKDAVLAAAFDSPYAPLLAPLALAGTLLTGVYVARALCLLWRGEGQEEPVAGAGWMGAGFAALAALAALLGLALGPLARLLGAELPEGLFVAALGLVAALFGLALGWVVSADRLLGPLGEAASNGFRLGGGFDGLVARPALALARALYGLDRALHARVQEGVGGGARRAARVARRADALIHGGVEGAGQLGLGLARASQVTDEKGIDGLIEALVRGTHGLGERARGLQTGLVHKELVIAAAAGALIFAGIVGAAFAGTAGSGAGP